MLWLRRLVLGAAARGLDLDPGAQARQPRGLRRALPGGVRRRLPHADPRRPPAPPLRAARAAPRRGPEMTEMTEITRRDDAPTVGRRSPAQAPRRQIQ